MRIESISYFNLPFERIFNLNKNQLKDHIKRLEDFYVNNNDDFRHLFLAPALDYIKESLNKHEIFHDDYSIKFRSTCLELLSLQESNNLDMFDIKHISALVLCVKFCRNIRKANSKRGHIRRTPQNVIFRTRERASNISLT